MWWSIWGPAFPVSNGSFLDDVDHPSEDAAAPGQDDDLTEGDLVLFLPLDVVHELAQYLLAERVGLVVIEATRDY